PATPKTGTSPGRRPTRAAKGQTREASGTGRTARPNLRSLPKAAFAGPGPAVKNRLKQPGPRMARHPGAGSSFFRSVKEGIGIGVPHAFAQGRQGQPAGGKGVGGV